MNPRTSLGNVPATADVIASLYDAPLDVWSNDYFRMLAERIVVRMQ